MICNKCKKEVKKKNQIRVAGYMRKTCRVCVNEISKKTSREKAKRIKEFKLW